jgi:hypothetical protein
MNEQARRIADQAKKVGQEEAERAAHQMQRAGEPGFDTVLRSWSELNKGWTSIAAEITDYSKGAMDDATHAWERALGARTLSDMVEAQAAYTKKAYDKHMAQLTRLGQMYVRMWETAFKPIGETSEPTG